MDKKIESELNPYLDSLRNMDKKTRRFKIFEKAVKDSSKKYGDAWKAYDFITRDIEWYTEYDAKEEVQTLFAYLVLVEGLGNAFTDLLVLLLAANGIDFHLESIHDAPHIRHAFSIRDLEKARVPLSAKLNFLRDNGIVEFAKKIDNKLRNDIAHLNFDIEDNQIHIRRTPAFEVVTKRHQELLDALKTVDILIRRLAKEKDLL